MAGRALLHPRHWPSWLGVGLFRLLALLPFPMLSAFGRALGPIAYVLAYSRRRVAEINLAICLPELDAAERHRLLREHFAYLGQATVCQGLGWFASAQRLHRIIRYHHRERLDERIRAGRPVILLTPHFLGLDLGGTATSVLVHHGMFMYQKLRNPVINATVQRGRTRFGSIPVERSDDLRSLIRELRRGTPFWYLPDQDPGRRRGVFAPFCGIPAATVSTLGRLARLAGADVLPTFAWFRPDGRGIDIHFDPPLADFPSGDETADTARMNLVIEQRLRDMPAQYFWVHRRFKTRPEGEAPIYSPKRRRRR